MNKIKQFVFKGLIFFSVISLLAASAHASSGEILKKEKPKKENSQNERPGFVLKSVSIEATVTYIHVNLIHIFHLIFDTFFTLKIVIPQNILSPDFLDGYSQVLFTKIIQTQAP